MMLRKDYDCEGSVEKNFWLWNAVMGPAGLGPKHGYAG
jgi:hypothetical protein